MSGVVLLSAGFVVMSVVVVVVQFPFGVVDVILVDDDVVTSVVVVAVVTTSVVEEVAVVVGPEDAVDVVDIAMVVGGVTLGVEGRGHVLILDNCLLSHPSWR